MAKPPTTYYVDNEEQTTDQQTLTVREILTNAGFDPDAHYLTEIKGNSPPVPHKDLNEAIHIHEKQKFAAIFTGQTPVSRR